MNEYPSRREATGNASSSGLVAYFGYGSLVCRATHRTEIVEAVPARLNGWRRSWRPRPDMPGFPAALLTVRPKRDAGCDGLLIFDRTENLTEIDAREARYRRVPLDRTAIAAAEPLPHDCRIWLYVADLDLPVHADPPLILQSYLDAMMLGFLTEHGEEGLRRFVTETDGFEIGIHPDRQESVYPRAVKLDTEVGEFFDRVLSELTNGTVAPGAIAG